MRVLEYSAGSDSLAAEISASEMTFSYSRRVPLDQVRAWFGQHVHVEEQPHPSYASTAKNFLILLAVLDILPVLLGGFNAFLIAAITAVLIYLPALWLDKFDQGTT